jgi:predicted transcriptional regulator
MSKHNWFKATSPSDRSGDILVSFDSKWRDSLSGSAIRDVVRRRYPKSFSPRRMYLYVGAPDSVLIGFADVNEVRTITRKDGIKLLARTGLTRREFDSYFAGYEILGCYAVSRTTLFKQPLSLEFLRSRSGFSPPQSFVALSQRASDWLAQQTIVGPPQDSR